MRQRVRWPTATIIESDSGPLSRSGGSSAVKRYNLKLIWHQIYVIIIIIYLNTLDYDLNNETIP